MRRWEGVTGDECYPPRVVNVLLGQGRGYFRGVALKLPKVQGIQLKVT